MSMFWSVFPLQRGSHSLAAADQRRLCHTPSQLFDHYHKRDLQLGRAPLPTWPLGKCRHGRREAVQSVRASAILDAYTSVFSNDIDGELAELYFTNTGALLLASTLAASVAINLLLSDLVLNVLVAGTFCLCFLASMVVGRGHLTLPLMALHRAGRFIWSERPFVNSSA